MASGHLAHHHLEGDGAPATKKRKVGVRVARPRGVANQFRQTDVSDVQQVLLHNEWVWFSLIVNSKVSSMFDGLEFCVINGSRSLTKQDIETKIAEVILVVIKYNNNGY